MTDTRDEPSREHGRRRRHSNGRSHRESHTSVEFGRALLLALVTLAPWLMIALRPGTEFWALGVVVICLITWGLSWRGHSSSFSAPAAVLPLVGGILLAVVQLVPLPQFLYPVVAPGAAALEHRLAIAGASDATASESEAHPQAWPHSISLYPAATRRNLTLLLLATAVFLLAARFLCHERNLFVLCSVLAGNGAALAFFGMVQHLTWNGKLFWTIPVTVNAQPFSTYINRNNAGGFLNMTLAGAVGLLYWSLERSGRPPGSLPDNRDSALVNLLVRWWDFLRWRVSRIDGFQTCALALTGLTATGILYSLSRGAILAMLVAGMVTALVAMILEKRFTGALVLCVAGLLTAGLLTWVSGTDRVAARMATLSKATHSDGRLGLWRDSIRAADDFKLDGAGLGTFRYVSNLYQQKLVAWFLHAENQYVEALVDAGIPGLLLVLAAIALTIWNLVFLLKRAREPAQRGLLLMGVFAVTSQVAISVVDFGLYQPANMVLFALICGLLAGRATHEWQTRSRSEPAPPIPWWRSAPFVVSLLLAGTLWGLYDSWRNWGVASAVLRAELHAQESTAMDEDELPGRIQDDLNRLESALASLPDDLEGHLAAYRLYLKEYQRRATRWLRPVVGANVPSTQLEEVIFLHAWVHHLKRTGQGKAVQALLEPELASEVRDPVLRQWAGDDIVRETLVPALLHLRMAHASTPLDARVTLGLAKLVWLDGEWGQEEVWLARTRLMAPGDGNIFAETGLLEQNLGNKAAVWKDWQIALGLGTSYEGAILTHARSNLPTDRFVAELLPPSPEYLISVAERLFAGQVQLQQQVAARAESLMSNVELSKPLMHHLRARLHLLKGELPLAAKSYERALKLEPEQTAWRVDLARLYFKQGRLKEALEEVRQAASNGKGTTEMLALRREINEALLSEDQKKAAPPGIEPDKAAPTKTPGDGTPEKAP